MTTTRDIIYAMLTSNTGSHMLDSGGAYGRHWERNASKSIYDFTSEPYATLDNYGEVTVSLFHHLDRELSYEEELDASYLEFTKSSESSYLEDIESWLEYMGATEIGSYNSYNYDSALSQVIQWTEFELDGSIYVALQIHQGCDVRGGYTRPYIFSTCDGLAYESASIFCTGEEEHVYNYSNGEWTLEGEYSSDFTPYQLKQEAKKVGITEYIPCYECGYPLQGTDTRTKVSA